MTALNQIKNEEMAFPAEVTILAGSTSVSGEAWEPFAPQVIDFLDTFSRALRKNERTRSDQEVMALAFWCRRAHLVSLQEKHGFEKTDFSPAGRGTDSLEGMETGPIRRETDSPEGHPLFLGRGRIFHLAPANVPMMFAYTWIIGLLAGNAGIIRISERTLRLEPVQAVLEVLREIFSQEAFAGICGRSSFISYERSDAVTEEILRHCDGRVLWGGDETIRQMRRIPMPAHAVEIAFPDRVSIAVISEKAVAKTGEEELRNVVHRFYNDTYMMDQNGCSSPQTVIWLKDVEAALDAGSTDQYSDRNPQSEAETGIKGEGVQNTALRGGEDISLSPAREKWWRLLAQEAEASYEMDGFRAARKLEKAAMSAMRPSGVGISEREQVQKPYVSAIRRYCGNELYVLSLSGMPADLAANKGGFGLFYETEAGCLEEIAGSFSPRIQTVVCIGVDPAAFARTAATCHSEGVLRFVEPGQALQIDTIWDGIDLIAALSRRIY